jgi:hypothetical protein
MRFPLLTRYPLFTRFLPFKAVGTYRASKSVMTDTADIRIDMAATRDRMSRDVDELKARAKQRLDVVQLVRDHPWTAVGVAVALGAVIGGTGAEEKAAVATAAAVRGTIDRLRSDDEPREEEPEIVEPPREKTGLGARVAGLVGLTVAGTLDRVLNEIRAASHEWGARAPIAARPAPKSVVVPVALAALGEQALTAKAVDAVPVPNEIAPAELGLRAAAVEAVGGGTHEPPLEPGAGELGARWS